MKSRCECINTVEDLSTIRRELHLVGKKIHSGIVKLVKAHERDVRECTNNATVAACLTQQGTDLNRAKIKHLPSEVRSEPQSSRLGSKESTLQINSGNTDASIGMDSETPKSSTLHDDDVVMVPPSCKVPSQPHSPTMSETENGHINREDTETGVDSREPNRSPIDLQNGIDAKKPLYTIADYPSDAYEVTFRTAFVNEIVKKCVNAIV
uniref:AlNc14C268G9913 protein n=1 Tax=Albugo laibachii Nc14 TaxID=890382 RepID=F0WU92_9STRA|nr:AlNc14C268G9913 [Albugo laibachii Nc14]|eukprot:CCA24970.1 AlNc14C268G9913 [Albugo laibachii Nc14]